MPNRALASVKKLAPELRGTSSGALRLGFGQQGRVTPERGLRSGRSCDCPYRHLQQAWPAYAAGDCHVTMNKSRTYASAFSIDAVCPGALRHKHSRAGVQQHDSSKQRTFPDWMLLGKGGLGRYFQQCILKQACTHVQLSRSTALECSTGRSIARCWQNQDVQLAGQRRRPATRAMQTCQTTHHLCTCQSIGIML